MDPSVPTEWTTEQELLLKNWGVRAKYFELMHYNSCRYYKYLDNLLGAPSVVIDAIITSVTFGSLAFTNCETDFIFKIISGNIMFISVTIAALHKYFKFSRISTQHNESHYRYSSIIKDIEEELAIDRKNREEPRIFMHKIKENFDNLLHSSPDIPKHIMNRYVEDLEKGERIKLTDKEILIRGKTNQKLDIDTSNNNSQINDEQLKRQFNDPEQVTRLESIIIETPQNELSKLNNKENLTIDNKGNSIIDNKVPQVHQMKNEHSETNSNYSNDNSNCSNNSHSNHNSHSNNNSKCRTHVENFIDIHNDIQSEFEQRLNKKKRQTLKDRIRMNSFV